MSSLPLGLNQVEMAGLNDKQYRYFCAVYDQELFGRQRALYCGPNALSRNLIMVDRKLPGTKRSFLGTLAFCR